MGFACPAFFLLLVVLLGWLCRSQGWCGTQSTTDQVMSFLAQWPQVSCDRTIAYQRDLLGFSWRKRERLFSAALGSGRQVYGWWPLATERREAAKNGVNTVERRDERWRENGLNDIFEVSKCRHPPTQRTHWLFRYMRKLITLFSTLFNSDPKAHILSIGSHYCNRQRRNNVQKEIKIKFNNYTHDFVYDIFSSLSN